MLSPNQVSPLRSLLRKGNQVEKIIEKVDKEIQAGEIELVEEQKEENSK